MKLSINKLKEEAILQPFDNEMIMHGFLKCILRNNMQKFIIPIQHEYKTHLFYHREKEINDGFSYRSETYNSLLQSGDRPKRGQIDFALLNPDNSLIPFDYDKRVRKAIVGIELQYPRGEGKNEIEFKEHIINDCKKLTDTENRIDLKYLICIVYGSLNFDALQFFDDEISRYKDLNFAYFNINSNSICEEKIIPNDWLL